LSGLLVFDKPLGWSSMQAVAFVRRRAGGVRTGHAGTLDPLATGVLVMALGAATKRIDEIMATEKRYRTTIDLSAFTTTDDREGQRTEVEVSTPPSPAQLDAALRTFIGTIMQRPPAFSAMKVGGRRAYKLARRGDDVQLAARPVTIHEIELVRYAWPDVEIDIRCAKGTYIRSLARDLGAALGTGGHCAALRRTAVGQFDESMAMRADDVPEVIDAASLRQLG
jgi:tRNA pseudouridine55 synthase